MAEVWINDVDLADYGFVPGANPQQADSPQFHDPLAPLIGQIGLTWLGEPVQVAARRLLVDGHILSSSAAAYRAAVDALKLHASSGAVRLRFADRPAQEFRDCRLMSMTASPRAAIFSNIAGDVSLAFEAADPLRYDVNPQGISLSTGRAALPIGTAPSFPVITIHGGGGTLSAITITVRNASGDVVQTMGLTISLGANDYIVVDCVRTKLTKSLAGVQSDATSTWTSGDFPVIRSADGWYESASYPSIELAGTGTPVGLCTYSRRWL